MTKTFTAPRAYIEIDGEMAGLVKNLSFSENISRANVQGLGSLNKQEVPPVAIDCQWSVDQYMIDLDQPVMKKLLNRYGTVEQLLQTLTLGEIGFAICVYAKTVTSSDANSKFVTAIDKAGKTIARLAPCYTNTQNFQLSEGGIAGLNVSGVYLNPISTI